MARMIPFLSAMIVVLCGTSNAGIALGATFSGGEIFRQDSYDMSSTTGIYGYGAAISLEGRHWESAVQLELGRYNRSNWYGVATEGNGKYGILRDNLKAYAGLGFAYNGYVYDSWLGHNSVAGEFTHDFSPYLTAKVELLERLRLGFEGIFESKIFWKARVGFQVVRFL